MTNYILRIARITSTWEGVVAFSPNEALGRVHDRLMASGATLVPAEAGSIRATYGSQVAFRIKGGVFSKLPDFPVTIDVTARELGNQNAGVSVVVTENFGVGTTLGARKKYLQACAMRCAELREAVEGQPQP